MGGGTIAAEERLLAALDGERSRWEALLEEVGPERLTVPGVAGEWSVKDLLGHLAAYHRFWGAQVRGAATGVAPTARDLFDTETQPPRSASEEEQNAAIRALYASLSAAVVLAKWREACDLLRDGVAALPEADVTTAGRFPWAGAKPLAEASAGDTHRHGAEHAAQVRAWLEGGA